MTAGVPRFLGWQLEAEALELVAAEQTVVDVAAQRPLAAPKPRRFLIERSSHVSSLPVRASRHMLP